MFNPILLAAIWCKAGLEGGKIDGKPAILLRLNVGIVQDTIPLRQ